MENEILFKLLDINEKLTNLGVLSNEIEGNIFTKHHSLESTDLLRKKQRNMISLVKELSPKRIAEIGFNAGHSAVLLTHKTPLQYVAFDIGEHSYSKTMWDSFKNSSSFSATMIWGDSRTTIPQYLQKSVDKFDLVHVDGGHSRDCARADITNSYELLKDHGVLLVDDTNLQEVSQEVDSAILTGKWNEIELQENSNGDRYSHRALCKNPKL